MKILFSYLLGTQCFFSFFVKASAVATAYSPSAITAASVQAQSGPSMPYNAFLCALMDSTGQYVFAAAQGSSNAGPYAFISTDYGQNYTQLTNTPNNNYEYCAGTSDLSVIYIMGSSNTLYKVIGGNVDADWTVLSPPSAQYNGVATDTDTGTFVALTNHYNGELYYSTDGGTQWSTSETYDGFFSIVASANGSIFHVLTTGVAVGYGNYFSLDHGETWTPGDLLPGPTWNSVSCNAAGTVVVTVGTYIYLSVNSGQNWNQVDGSVSDSWLAVAISPNINLNSQYTILASDNSGATFFSNDLGQSWNQAQSLNEIGNAFGLSSDGYYSVMGGSPYMWYGQSYGENWCISKAGVSCNLVYVSTQSPTTIPTASPTPLPTVIPTASPSTIPTALPTASPSAIPTASPTAVPTVVPTASPSTIPTALPTASPSAIPTASPTAVPTYIPSAAPTASPSAVPTPSPSAVPTAVPTYIPSSRPSSQPTMFPSSQPISDPTGKPSVAPSSQPSNQPTSHPTQNNQHSALLTDGQIAGIIIGSVIGSLVLLTAIYYFLRNNSSKVVVENHDPSKSRSYEAVVLKDDRPLSYSKEAAMITVGGENDCEQNTNTTQGHVKRIHL